MGLAILFMLLSLASLGLVIWGIVDAAQRPDAAWQQAGQNKTLWIVLQAVGLLFCVGGIFAVIYLAAVRPQVDRAGGPAY